MPDLHGLVAAIRLGGVTIYPLLGLAVVAVVVILEKAYLFAARTRPPARLVGLAEADTTAFPGWR